MPRSEIGDPADITAGMEKDIPIRVGVIGLGLMGATHVAAYQRAADLPESRCVLTAVCDQDAARCSGRLSATPGHIPGEHEPRAFDCNVVKACASAEELLANPNVDLVSICTPTPSHVALAEMALRAGKHVLLEKPVAITIEPIERLAALVRETGKLCMPAMCMRYWPAWSWLKEQKDAGTYGALLGLSLTRMGGAPTWSPSFFLDGSKSGGALVDLHLHDVDFLYHLFGAPAEVTSAGFPGPSSRIDRVNTLYRYPDHPALKLATAESSWEAATFAFRMRYVATFERATADFDISRPDQLILCKDNLATPVEVSPLTGYDFEVRAALRAVRTGDFARLPTVAEAANVTRVLLAEEQSAVTGKTIRVGS